MGKHENEKRQTFAKRQKVAPKKKNKFSRDTSESWKKKTTSNTTHVNQQSDDENYYTSKCNFSSNGSDATEKSPFHILGESGGSAAKQPSLPPK